jgi:hypothetical protein
MLSPGLSTSDVSGKRMPMNLREGVRRLALLLGAVGAIFAAFASCVELRTVLKQTLRHNRFEQLANSQAVQDSRNCWKGVLSERGCNEEKTGPGGVEHQLGATNALMAWSVVFPNSQAIGLPDGQIRDFPISMSKEQIANVLQKEFPSGSAVVRHEQLTKGPWEEFPLSVVDRGEISVVRWNADLGIASIETRDGQILYPTPSPAWWTYPPIVLFPILGFFIPWGAVRASGWIGSRFRPTIKGD